MIFKTKSSTASHLQRGRKLSEDVLQSAEDAVIAASEKANAACTDAQRIQQQAREYVAQQPVQSLLIASAAGALLMGALWAFRSHH